MATAAWWKVYLAVTPIVTVSTAASAGRRFGTTGALWMLPAGPVLGALVTWIAVRTRRTDEASGLDPVLAATAREELEHGHVPEDPAVREVARQLLPGLIEQQRRIERRYILPICGLAAVVLALLAAIADDSAYLIFAGVALLCLVLARVAFASLIRRYERFRREM